MKRYLVYTHDYTRLSAGVRALHKLVHYLNLSGCEAYVTSEVRNPEWCTPLAPYELQKEIAQNGVVIYPEVEAGNKLDANQVVRFILNIPGMIRGDKEVAPGEKAWAYSGILRRYLDNPLNVLTVPVIDRGVFGVGIGAVREPDRGAYFLGREYCGGERVPDDSVIETPHWFDEISREWPRTQAGVSEVFRRSSVFITHTAYTMLIHEARLCGCPVIVVPGGLWSRGEFARAMPGMNGMAWGGDFAEYARAQATVGAFPHDYDEMTAQFFVQLERFIDKTQRWN